MKKLLAILPWVIGIYILTHPEIEKIVSRWLALGILAIPAVLFIAGIFDAKFLKDHNPDDKADKNDNINRKFTDIM